MKVVQNLIFESYQLVFNSMVSQIRRVLINQDRLVANVQGYIEIISRFVQDVLIPVGTDRKYLLTVSEFTSFHSTKKITSCLKFRVEYQILLKIYPFRNLKF